MTPDELKELIKEIELRKKVKWVDTAVYLCGQHAKLSIHDAFVVNLQNQHYVLASEGGDNNGFWGVFSVTHKGKITYFKITMMNLWKFVPVDRVQTVRVEWIERG